MYNVLVVDDKEIFRRKISKIQYFYDCNEKFCVKYMAENGMEALELLQIYDDIDVILTDIQMPIMDGIELLREVKKQNLCKCTILLSAYSDFQYAREGLVNGAFDYILKPIDENNVKGVFDRAYEHLKRQEKNRNIEIYKIELMIENLFNNPSEVDEIVDEYIRNIKSEEVTLNELKLRVAHFLKEIKIYINYQYNYLSNYIPLNDICAFPSHYVCKEEIIDVLKRKLSVLVSEIKIFFVKPEMKIIQDVCNYIIENIDSDVSLQLVANQFSISRKYLSAIFKNNTGYNYVEWITTLKIKRAKFLLSGTDLLVYEVAAQIGFADVDYFSKVFKKRTKVSPSEFRWNDYF